MDRIDRMATSPGKPDSVALAAPRPIEPVRDLALFTVDRQGRVASWNDGVERILGWNREDWIGQPVTVAFTPEDVDQGVNVGYLKVLRDFTAHREAAQETERLLRSESEAWARADNQAAGFSAAIETLSDGVCIGDRHRVQRCNRAALDLLGLGSVDALQADGAVLVQRLRLRRERNGPLLDSADLPCARAARCEPVSMELWVARGGEAGEAADICLRCSAHPVRVDGVVVGAAAVFTDLTERLSLHRAGSALSQAETDLHERDAALHERDAALHERDAELRALVDGVRDYAIFTISPDGFITSWHQGAVLMKGYTALEAIGMRYEQLFKPDDRAAGRPQMEMEVAARTGEYKGDGERLRKDGTVFDAAVVLTPLRGPDGQLRGFLKLTHDITARKRMEREREVMLRDAQVARHEAECASLSKDEFLATISHELRTPLSAIQGWAHVLERGVCDTETVQHGLAAISRDARTQVQLIEDLLDMNRIQSGHLRLDLQRIELGGVIAAAIDAALPAATAKGIGLRTVFGAGSGQVMGDAARLQQVVGNLLNNAIKFTPQGGQVSVMLKQRDGGAELAVSDTGQGIAADFLPLIFQRFQQQDASITRRHGGLGIGLAIVRHLVALHGGQVQRRRRAASGRRPAGAPPAGALQAEPAGRSAAVVQLDGVRVLLVDDEPDVRAVTERVLQDAGAQVLVASQASQGLALLQQKMPTVILSDIGMPGIEATTSCAACAAWMPCTAA